jgi:hypothetical protein
MSVSVSTEVYGIKSAIKELKKIDPIYRKQLDKDAAQIAQPVVDAAKSAYPVEFLSGMQFKWSQKGKVKFPYTQKAAQRGVQVKVDTSKKNKGTIVITQKNPAAALIDMAGKKGGSNARGEAMIKNLQTKFGGKPSRIMWPAYDAKAPQIEQNIADLVETIMEKVNRNIVAI